MPLITTFICEHCNRAETLGLFCEMCIPKVQDISENTKIDPTSGHGVIRYETKSIGGMGSYAVYNDTDECVAVVSHYNKTKPRQISDAVLTAHQWEMWELIVEVAKEGNQRALDLVARADATFWHHINEE